MAITGIDTIDGKQIIAAGAVSAKSAEMAYNDENGNPITGYQVAGDYYSASNPSGFITGVDLTPYQTTAGMTAYQSAGDYYSASNPSGFITGLPEEEEVEFEEIDLTDYQPVSAMTAYTNSADVTGTAQYGLTTAGWSEITAGGSAPTYDYTDNDLISAIDSSGLYATSALEAKSANALVDGGRLGSDVYAVTGVGTNSTTLMILNPQTTPFGTTSGIYGPLYYAQGACMTYGSSAGSTQYFGGFFKGNEWYISNATAGQALRGETHASRGVHISGATTAGYGFNLGILSVSGVNSTGSWKYGYREDAALRAVSSCDMYESAFEYDANDKISGYNGSAFAGGSDVPEGVMVESGLEYNAVNEISGYNGSAIAQYGAEKQWLVHDDTLVHASNSAQYALGVNLSAVAQLLGVDETVLWSGSKGSIGDTIDLSEPVSAFNKIKFQIDELNADIPYHDYISNTNRGTLLYPYYIRTNGSSAQVCGMWSLNRSNNDTRLSVSVSVLRTNGTGTGINGSKIIKVIGIGRKS